MINKTLLLTSLTISISLHLLQTSYAKKNLHCPPSTCGNIRNISYPFRLKTDPKHCGISTYELSCDNNTTSIFLNSHKYHVLAINYHNFTIRLVDVAMRNDSCSFPQHSLYHYHFKYTFAHSIHKFPYSIHGYKANSSGYFPEVSWPITFISCQYQVRNHSLLVKTDRCAFNGRHVYIRVGHWNSLEVEDMCTIEMIVMTSWKFEDFNNVSFVEIHEALLYGFELSWYFGTYFAMSKGTYCHADEDGTKVTCHPAGCLVFYCVNAGDFQWFFNGLNWTIRILLWIIGLSIGARIIIGFPCVFGLLIYKFQTRNLSMFHIIEGFLQSNNGLKPIRYSYSDIKTMTRSFREKLGEGGYGSVYKGKLRSGHYVAVKLLNKSNANVNDFINEISTIGRIHHVNIVKLVGYCVERSKRALVYDFMPNGSLEKYILNQERTNSLSWQTKHAIAVGVARGIWYLHRGCDIQILHFDIKPHNILLDHKFIPKISDFGLAKSYSTEKNNVTLTVARGTIGYVAPELINRSIGTISYKADVYSFGMLLMEIVGLNRDLIRSDDNSSQYFPYWIYDRFEKGEEIRLGNEDNNDDDFDDHTKKICRKMTIVALWCTQINPEGRPSMNKVVEMLEGEDEFLQIPPRPFESSQVVRNDDQMSSICSSESDYVSLILS